MNRAMHTPGPWDQGSVVATGLPLKLQRYGAGIWWRHDLSDEEAQANLRLMDAAPELLDLAFMFEAYAEAAMKDALEAGDLMDVETWRTCKASATEVIAKATGAAAKAKGTQAEEVQP